MLAQSQKWLDGDASRETVTPHEELTAGHSPYLDNALDACDLGLLVVNRYAQVAHWNAWLERAAELQREVVLGHTLLELFPELRASQLVGAIRDALERDVSATICAHLRHETLPLYHDPDRPDGAKGTPGKTPMHQSIVVRPFDAGAGERRCLVQIQDVTGAAARDDELRERNRNLADSNRRIYHLTNHDDLTGLPNRTSFKERLVLAVQQAERRRELLGIMFIDIDRFKRVNEELGDYAGDRLLQQVARRIEECPRASDTVARLGGDEFAIILSRLNRADHAVVVARKLLARVAQPFDVDGNQIHITASVGISVFPVDGRDPVELLKDADIAMYHAKDESRNSYRFFCPAMQADTQKRMRLEKDLRQALEADEFLLHYQPQICLKTNSVVGLEALVRWQHPERGMVPPAEFIPAAEDNGLIVQIGEWVLREACRQQRAWAEQLGHPLKLAINLSAAQFKEPDLLELIRHVIEETGVLASSIELEITESFLMEDAESAAATLDAFHDLGISVAIDDFGTGYSSLGYLRRFTVDKIKIDRTFVNDIGEDPDDAAIVDAVIGLGHSLGHCVIAEGVETPAQLAYLKARGCDAVQGFHFSRPLPALDVAEFIANW